MSERYRSIVLGEEIIGVEGDKLGQKETDKQTDRHKERETDREKKTGR